MDITELIKKIGASSNANKTLVDGKPIEEILEEIRNEDLARLEKLKVQLDKFNDSVSIAKACVFKDEQLDITTRIRVIDDLSSIHKRNSWLYVFLSNISLSTIIMFIFFVIQAF